MQRALTDEARSSFEGPWSRLGDEGRWFLIAATFLHADRIDPGLLREVLAQQLGWSDKKFDAAVDACADLFLVAGDVPLQIHRLLARFVREKARDWRVDFLAQLRQGLWERLLTAADKVEEQPASAERALRLLSFDVSVESWSGNDPSGAIAGEEAHRIGSALSHIGQFEAAQL